jgi:hypothetical protein
MDEDERAVVVQWFQQQPREFFVEGIHWLVHQWNACFNTHGDLLLIASIPIPRKIPEWILFQQTSHTRKKNQWQNLCVTSHLEH